MDTKIMEMRLKQWMPIFEAQAESGLNKEAWCTENGIKRWEFFKWQREIRKYILEHNKQDQEVCITIPSASQQTSFIDITPTLTLPTTGKVFNPLIDSYGCTAAPSVCVKYGGFSIDLPKGVDGEFLSTVLKAVKNVE